MESQTGSSGSAILNAFDLYLWKEVKPEMKNVKASFSENGGGGRITNLRQNNNNHETVAVLDII